MFGPDNNHLIERLLALAIANEEARQRLLTIQINNENYRTELLLREHELVEQSAAHVAATSKAQEELQSARKSAEGLPVQWVSPDELLSRRDDYRPPAWPGATRSQCTYCLRFDGEHQKSCPKSYVAGRTNDD